MIVFDSLSGPPRSRIVQVLKEYLQVEWVAKKGGELNRGLFKGCVPKVPQQNNYSDCGVYVLQYVESFFEVSFYLVVFYSLFTIDQVLIKLLSLRLILISGIFSVIL